MNCLCRRQRRLGAWQVTLKCACISKQRKKKRRERKRERGRERGSKSGRKHATHMKSAMKPQANNKFTGWEATKARKRGGGKRKREWQRGRVGKRQTGDIGKANGAGANKTCQKQPNESSEKATTTTRKTERKLQSSMLDCDIPADRQTGSPGSWLRLRIYIYTLCNHRCLLLPFRLAQS